MYRVLVAVGDDEDRVSKQVNFVKSLPGSTDEVDVTVVHAVKKRQGSRDLQKPDRIPAVRQAARQLSSDGYSVSEEDAREDPVEGIVTVADDIDADLIVLGGRKRSPAGKAVFGSVTQSVILTTDRPVAVTGI
ncbi:universal stress protein [Halobacterium wangiae]|uniref:universal stress protein n=1 Tax=Halobacterium wangiae TaxID=2902623 RepID=UPI001E6325C2|nr:universal stress protein [Halobacterium wangiae]